jgi:hypothetical protein
MVLTDVLLMLHFLSLAAGFVNMFGGIALALASAGAAPGDGPVLRRMMPALLRVGTWGVAGLWVTGVLLLWLRWNWQAPLLFHGKLAAVVGLTVVTGYIHMLAARARRAGDPRIMAKAQVAGPFAGVFALAALILAVLTFH